MQVLCVLCRVNICADMIRVLSNIKCRLITFDLCDSDHKWQKKAMFQKCFQFFEEHMEYSIYVFNVTQ